MGCGFAISPVVGVMTQDESNKKRDSIYIYIWRIRDFSPPPTLGQPVHYEARLGTPPPFLGSRNTKKHVLEVNWMGITGYLPL